MSAHGCVVDDIFGVATLEKTFEGAGTVPGLSELLAGELERILLLTRAC